MTPSRANGNVMGPDPSMTIAVGQTPAPPGAWKGTPVAPERKGILKVRFDESTAINHTNEVSQGATNVPNAIDTSSDIDDEPGPTRAVRLVDSFGRERRFDEDGKEVNLPPVSLARELSMSKHSPSVRLVDSMGNELDPSATSPDNTSDLGDITGPELISKLSSKVIDARKSIESFESRFVVRMLRFVYTDEHPPTVKLSPVLIKSSNNKQFLTIAFLNWRWSRVRHASSARDYSGKVTLCVPERKPCQSKQQNLGMALTL